jgi:hypothetical protein
MTDFDLEIEENDEARFLSGITQYRCRVFMDRYILVDVVGDTEVAARNEAISELRELASRLIGLTDILDEKNRERT